MLLPALGKAREKAQAIACTSKMKQLGLYELMYAADFEDYLCITRNYDDPHDTWFEVLAAYATGGDGLHQTGNALFFEQKRNGWYSPGFPQVPLCPSIRQPQTDLALTPPYTTNGRGGYARNRYFGYWRGGAYYVESSGNAQAQVRTGSVRQPSRTALQMDGYMYYIGAAGAEWKSYARFPHSGRMNLLFADGHVGNLKGNQKATQGGTDVIWNRQGIHFRPDAATDSSGLPKGM